jgi:hypothetical protein
MNGENLDRVEGDEVFGLCEKTLNGELSDTELKCLETLVIENAWARRMYVEYMHQHAGLHWQHAGEEGGAFSLATLESQLAPEGGGLPGQSEDSAGGRQSDGKVVAGPWTWRRTAAVAAILVGGVVLGWGAAGRITQKQAVATLVKATNCSWQSGTLPTDEGAELQAGRLRLQEGLARLRFASGAEVTLEAPVDIELLSPMLCRLHRGTVVAKVPERAQGFSIETATATLVDHGTEFGVHVGRRGEETNVVVFDGIVDVEQRGSGEVQRLRTGNGSRVGSGEFRITESAPLELVSGEESMASGINFHGKKVITITTSEGRGEDAYVQTAESDIHTSEVLLLAKNSEVFDKGLGYSRKIYLRFDLKNMPPDVELADAELELTIKRSGFGYASFVPDAEFVVFGVRDVGWTRSQLTWGNAPANNSSGGGADLSEAVELGSFVIPQGVYSGKTGIKGDALVGFLEREKKRAGMTTLLVVRRTGEIRRGGGLVHAFASARHPNAAPPTLKLSLAE